ncbi:hypothetical protein GIB67_010357 [Kingdonia uniflora]|uniref:Dolichyl-diphosphooligosaccharide--protein glycosyltransferase subunit 4 n=1 Tax=Kingdonia uniflora TaxID=39325 RepID=A0A7J7MA59_9MAGN|nr:hypothetical protein GIB67_010357 [Kingdonia uniflora]
MIDDQDLGFLANLLGISIYVLVITYHYIIADQKYEGNCENQNYVCFLFTEMD